MHAFAVVNKSSSDSVQLGLRSRKVFIYLFNLLLYCFISSKPFVDWLLKSINTVAL